MLRDLSGLCHFYFFKKTLSRSNSKLVIVFVFLEIGWHKQDEDLVCKSNFLEGNFTFRKTSEIMILFENVTFVNIQQNIFSKSEVLKCISRRKAWIISNVCSIPKMQLHKLMLYLLKTIPYITSFECWEGSDFFAILFANFNNENNFLSRFQVLSV